MTIGQSIIMTRCTLARLLATLFAAQALLAGAVEVRFERVAENVYAHVGDIGARSVTNEGLNANLGLVVTPAGAVLPVSSTRAWLEAFAALEQLAPQRIVPGHGRGTDPAAARSQTCAYLEALRAHMQRAVEQGVDVSEAVKSFDARPFLLASRWACSRADSPTTSRWKPRANRTSSKSGAAASRSSPSGVCGRGSTGWSSRGPGVRWKVRASS